MKKLYSTLFLSGVSMSVFAAAESLVGGATSDSATPFSSAYDNTTTLTLTAPDSSSASYFTGNSATVKTLTSTGDVDYIVNGDLNIDPNGETSVIVLKSSANTDATFMFDNGTVNVGNMITDNAGIGFALNTYITSNTMKSGIVIGENSTFNVYTSKLTLDGPYGNANAINPVNAFVVNGTLNVLIPNSEYVGGDLYIKWGTKSIDGTTRGSRTAVNVDGGQINAGNLSIDVYDRLNVKNGGSVNLSGNLSLLGAGTNQAQLVNIMADSNITANGTVIRVGYDTSTKISAANIKIIVNAGQYNGGNLSFTAQNEAVTTAVGCGIYGYNGATATFTTADLSKMGNVHFETGSTFNATTTLLGGTSLIDSSAATLNLGSLTQTGGMINVYGGGEVNIAGDSSITGESQFVLATATANVKSGELTFGLSQLTMGATSKFNVENGAKFTSASDFGIYSGTLTTANNSTFTANNITLLASTNVTFNGDVVTTKTGTSNFYSLVINNGSRVTFGENATFNSSAYGRMSLMGDIVVNSGEKSIMTDQLVFWSKANVVEINGKNSFYASNGTLTTILNITQTNSARFIVRNTSTFGQVTFQQEKSGTDLTGLWLDLDFASAEDYIQFSKAEVFGTVARIYINNADDNKIKFLDNSALLGKLNVFDFDGNVLNYQWVSDAVNGGYWLNVVVPEPAEWAAIFGGFALALAVWRRRK